MSARNYSRWPFSNVAILSSYVSDSASDGFQRIFILMMLNLLTFYVIFFTGVICRGLISACTSALIQSGVDLFMIVYRDGLG